MSEKKKDIRDYLHLYLGCEVWDEMTGKKTNVFSITPGNSKIPLQLVRGKESVGRDYTDVKLLLRPLSDWSLRDSAATGIEMGNMPSVFALGVYEPKLFHYLLSNHFDLFDLIPEGLAIDKTKTP